MDLKKFIEDGVERNFCKNAELSIGDDHSFQM